MIRYAEILNGRVRHIGEAPKLPEFRLPLIAVDLTGVSPLPKEHWRYDARLQTFTQDVAPARPGTDTDTQAVSALLAKGTNPPDFNVADRIKLNHLIAKKLYRL